MPDQEIITGLDDILEDMSEHQLTHSGYPASFDNDAVTQKISESEMSAEFIIVTRNKATNRNDSMVHILPHENYQGMMLENYVTNPVVLWNHGYDFSLPIGISEDRAGKSTVKLMKKRAEATVYFSQVLPEAEMIFALIAEGILRTASIGFMPQVAKRIKIEDKRKMDDDTMAWSGGYGFDFLESEMFEWSVVDVPADPGALRKRLELGNCGGVKLRGAMKRSLSRVAEKPEVQGIGLDLPEIPGVAAPESCAKKVEKALRLQNAITEGFHGRAGNLS